jgi:hypothetical protein
MDLLCYSEIAASFQVDPQKRQSWYRNEALASGPVKMQGLMLPQMGHVWLICVASIIACLFSGLQVQGPGR